MVKPKKPYKDIKKSKFYDFFKRLQLNFIIFIINKIIPFSMKKC